MAIHDIGDVVTMWVVWRDEGGAQADTTTTMRVRAPDGMVSTLIPVAADPGDETLAEAATGQDLTGVTGVYRAELELDQAGTWRYRFIGTGAVDDEQEGRLYAMPDLVGAA